MSLDEKTWVSLAESPQSFVPLEELLTNRFKHYTSLEIKRGQFTAHVRILIATPDEKEVPFLFPGEVDRGRIFLKKSIVDQYLAGYPI